MYSCLQASVALLNCVTHAASLCSPVISNTFISIYEYIITVHYHLFFVHQTSSFIHRKINFPSLVELWSTMCHWVCVKFLIVKAHHCQCETREKPQHWEVWWPGFGRVSYGSPTHLPASPVPDWMLQDTDSLCVGLPFFNTCFRPISLIFVNIIPSQKG